MFFRLRLSTTSSNRPMQKKRKIAMRKILKPTEALVALAIVLAPTLVQGQTPSGALDSSFGAGGKVTTDFLGSADFAASVALQPDGKVVVAGTAYVNAADRKSTRLNSSHMSISYAVFCLKKKKTTP